MAAFAAGAALRGGVTALPAAQPSAGRAVLTTDEHIAGLGQRLTRNPVYTQPRADLAAAYLPKNRDTADPSHDAMVQATIRDALGRAPDVRGALAWMGDLQSRPRNAAASSGR